MYNKEIYVKDYFNIHNYYSKIYGEDRTIILMQVGSFHECYATDNYGLNLVHIAEQLDVICTQKNSSKPISKSNPRMLGFPVYVVDNFIEKLCNLNYTVVLIDQVSKPPKPKREVTGIFSPATFLQKNINYSVNKSTFLLSIVIDKIKHNKTNKSLFCIGLSSYDLTTGKGCIYETYSINNDEMFALDDTIRFLEKYPPREILIYYNNELDNKINGLVYDDIISYLNLDIKYIYKIENKKNIFKLSYQKEILNRTFNNQINIIDLLDLHLYNWLRCSLTILIEYVYNHQPDIIKNLKPPIFFTKSILFLGNRSLDQLDVFPKKTNQKSLFNIIDFTKSSLGKRYLRDSLSSPLINKEDIKLRNNIIEEIINSNLSNIIGDYLVNIYDIEKLNRRLEIEKIHPYELYNFYTSYQQIILLISEIKNNTKLYDKLKLDNKQIKKLNKLVNYIEKIFNIEMLSNLNFINYKEESKSFLNKDINKKIDKLQVKIDSCINFIDNLINILSSLIDDNKKNNLINLKYNERNGHYMLITKRRCKMLKEKLKTKKYIKVGDFKLDIKDFDFVEMTRSNNTKLTCPKIKEMSLILIGYKYEMAELLKKVFKKKLRKISKKYNKTYNYWTHQISLLDFLNSGALGAIKLGYCKPKIVSNDFSYFKAEQLRHPIVEIINQDIEYHPYSIGLGYDNELDGILLYGINSSGKSTLMKSIGLNMILAQIGYYVSAVSFELSPYHSIFTRINGNDNIFRGLSSFMVEMVELMAILKRNNKNTLVIGDEICRGTEEKSANIIVAYMLETLAKSKTSFITATHLHHIAKLPSVKKIKRVKPMHLKVEYDIESDTLIYNRKLENGQGEKFYGVQVAKFIMKNINFNNRTKELENEYDNNNNKSSKYNSNNWVIQCYFCNKKNNLETHHINWQKDCINNKVINKPHLNKNSNYNLLTVCSHCHDKIDSNEININGWVLTSKGKQLQYTKQNKKNNKKYSPNDIKLVKEINNTCKTIKQTKHKIKNKLKLEISTTTINKICKNKY